MQIRKVWRATSKGRNWKSFEMDLPCFLLSWLRNLQLIPLTQVVDEEGDDIFTLQEKERSTAATVLLPSKEELFDHIKAIPQNLAPKNSELSQKLKKRGTYPSFEHLKVHPSMLN